MVVGVLRRQTSDPRRAGGGDPRDLDMVDPRSHDLTDPTEQDELSDDDNAQDIASDADLEGVEKEDPLLLSIDDLEGRVVSSLDEVKMHPGTRSSSGPGAPTLHQELATLLRPVLEIAAHSGPSAARTYASYRPGGVDQSAEEAYQRLNSDLILPIMVEMASSDTVPAKRAASLEFFHSLWKECHAAGSWLDSTAAGPAAGPYGAGGGTLAVPSMAPGARLVMRRRAGSRLAREGELLRYWVQASIACTVPGAFTSASSEGAVASRGVIAASASLRPSLRHIAQRIRDADDRGALNLYKPVMKMVLGVLRKLFVVNSWEEGGANSGQEADALRSACIKFLEITVLCFSSKVQPGAQGLVRRRGQSTEDFSLEDLPAGHPVITREILEEVGEYAFTTLRGLTLIGGQVKIDENLLPSEVKRVDGGGSGTQPWTLITSILKAAALAYLEIESRQPSDGGEEFNLDRDSIELEFDLSQKSYALTINAVAMLATNRPVFYKESATCIARRAMDPPLYDAAKKASLTKAAVLGITSHLRASCLTLLRNALSVSSNGWEVLHRALSHCGMGPQADKALAMAKQAAALKTAGRAARNRAAIFYEWDASEDRRKGKRQRETDDALAKMRAAKAARGLGAGIQLPASMVDAVELILANLTHLPETRPPAAASGAEKNRKRPITLDFVVDAVMTNGASLSEDECRWYDRDGGTAWEVDTEGEEVNGGRGRAATFSLDAKTLAAATTDGGAVVAKGKQSEKEVAAVAERKKLFDDQCNSAASDAFGRIVLASSRARSKGLSDFGNQIAARLAWTLRGVQPSAGLRAARDMASEGMAKRTKASKVDIKLTKAKEGDEKSDQDSMKEFMDEYPLVASCLAMDMVPGNGGGGTSVAAGTAAAGGLVTPQKNVPGGQAVAGPASTLANRVLNEAYLQSFGTEEGQLDSPKHRSKYDKSLDLFVSSVVHACDRANEKPNDNDRKKIATQAASSLPAQLAVVPAVTPSALTHAAAMCDIEEVTKKAAEAARKASTQTLAASAAAHAAKGAAEKRATAALLALRDAAFQRSRSEVRRSAVDCAVAIAAGRLPASPSVEEKALKLVMNVLFPKSTDLASAVVASATDELERAASYAIECHREIQDANLAALAKRGDRPAKDTLPHASDEEKAAMERVKKPAVLLMALCVRRPEIIKTLMSISCREGADVLSKAVKTNMPKLARAAATKHGAATIALKFSEMADEGETTMLLSFLDNLAPSTDKTLPSQELIDACHKIQDNRLDSGGKKDPRYIIPVVSGMKRTELVSKLPEFVSAKDEVFKAALNRMSERVGRHALLFRDEPDKENPTLHGMTLCEEVVYLHRLDFASSGLPQKRYLDAIRLCLEEDSVFTDRVIMAALDYISNTFLAGEEGLPLAYMRTIILTCSKHESLHSWICHVLLPRLIEGRVYADRRQWEGWMRCAKMLENTGDGGVSSADAIRKLPEEQLRMYRAKYPKKG